MSVGVNVLVLVLLPALCYSGGIPEESGNKSPPCLTCSPGPIGRQGLKGEKGNAGLSWRGSPRMTIGRKGNRGPHGSKGDKGEQGAEGAHGAIGLPGVPGKEGSIELHKGQPGLPGKNGAPGVPGRNGNHGARGPPGWVVRGMPGDVGSPGYPGMDGLPGPKAKFCLDRKRGAPGVRGKNGAAGDTGPPGEKGVKGSYGEKGEPSLGRWNGTLKGVKGQPGYPGEDGAPGLPGQDGSPGVPGKDGIDIPGPIPTLNCVQVKTNGNNAICPAGYKVTGCACGMNCGSWVIENDFTQCFGYLSCNAGKPLDWTRAVCCKIGAA